MPATAASAAILLASPDASAQCGDPLTGSCCMPHGTGGCDDLGCCVTVGNVDFSCLVEWDSVCAALAVELCGNVCVDEILPEPEPQANAAYGIALDWADGPFIDDAALVAAGSYLRNDTSGAKAIANAGSMTILRRGADGLWQEDATLFATEPVSNTYFGRSVAVSKGATGNFAYAIAGAYRDSQVAQQRGAAHVFVSNVPGTWSPSTVLRPTFSQGAVANEWFGFSVAAGHVPANGSFAGADEILVGAPRGNISARGAIYTYRRNGKAWDFQTKITTLSSASYNGSQFGWSVDFEPNVATGQNELPLPAPYKVLVIGAPGYNAAAGRVFVAEKLANTDWTSTPQKTLAIAGLVPGDRYGDAVSIASRFVAIGIPGKNGARGAVQIFERIGNTVSNWRNRLQIAPEELLPDDRFGSAVSLKQWWTGQVLLAVGARGDATNLAQSGAVYLYVWTPGDPPDLWVPLGKHFDVSPELGAQFGFSVAAGDIQTVVGAPFSNTAVPGPPPVILNNAGEVQGVFP
ncbi:MAG: hypothetical protein ACO3EP_01710 [Phycisphaerales bacterium]